MAEYIEVTGIKEALERYNAIQSTSPDMNRQLKKIIKYVISQAAKDVRKETHKKENVGRDPRKSYLAVKNLVYKRIFGGNISLLSRSRRGNYAASIPPQHSQSGRGGNRRVRSDETRRIMSYWGADRAFILRFLNSGTNPRFINVGANARKGGKRGAISPRNWFASSSQSALEHQSQALTQAIDEAIQKYWKK